MMPDELGIYSGHMHKEMPECLFFGPDENTADFMDWAAEHARERKYRLWKALTTGKSVKLGGVPHDVYGMTTASVHTYVLELLRQLGSNEILVSKDKTIGVVDGSGVLYDPAGLCR